MGDDDEPVVEMLFRNGTLTVVGIILSFSLTFLTQWAANPVPWGASDIPAVLMLAVGICVQGRGLVLFLRHDSLRRRVYDRATCWFLCGLATTTFGVFLAIAADLLHLLM
ncbi:MAG TPA: hypothetical protein VGC14_26770 [Rhizobium sp.]